MRATTDNETGNWSTPERVSAEHDSERSVSLAVVGHHLRLEMALCLTTQLDGKLFLDDGSFGEWANHARALEWASQQPTPWAALVQDDALPIDGFRQHLEHVATAMPARTACSLYVGTGRPRATQVTRAVAEADRVGASWLDCDGLLWGVAIMLPTGHIGPLLDWAANSFLPYDQRISAWYRTQGQRVRHCWPSLVDHADGPTLATSHLPAIERRAHHVGPPTLAGPTVSI